MIDTYTELTNFVKDYTDNYKIGMDFLSVDLLHDAINIILDTITHNGTIFACGNGGSGSLSDHLVCDCLKGIRSGKSNLLPKVVSLVSNGALTGAIANDISYDKIFSYQLESFLDINSEYDTLICISSSGNSPNVIEALAAARARKVKTIAMVGFDGGKIKKNDLADIILHVPINNYGISEDCFQSMFHIISQYLSG